MICNAHVASIQEVLRFGIYLMRPFNKYMRAAVEVDVCDVNEEFDPLVPISIPVHELSHFGLCIDAILGGK